MQVIEQFPWPYSDQLGQEGINKQYPSKVFDTICHMRTLRSVVNASVASRCFCQRKRGQRHSVTSSQSIMKGDVNSTSTTINRQIQHSDMPQPQGCEAQASRKQQAAAPSRAPFLKQPKAPPRSHEAEPWTSTTRGRRQPTAQTR